MEWRGFAHLRRSPGDNRLSEKILGADGMSGRVTQYINPFYYL